MSRRGDASVPPDPVGGIEDDEGGDDDDDESEHGASASDVRLGVAGGRADRFGHEGQAVEVQTDFVVPYYW